MERNIAKNCKYLILSCIIFISGALNLSGQDKKGEAPPLKERIFYGGSFGLQLGSVTNIELSPVAGLWVLPRIAVAAGPTYRFYKVYDEKTNIIGLRSYVEIVVLRDIEKFIPLGMNTSIFLHAENELLSLETEFWKNIIYDPARFYENTVLAGAGLSQGIGKRSSVNLMVLWALSENQYDLYGNPEFRICFIF
jgi:hypothetical protein